MKRPQIKQKFVYGKFYVHEKFCVHEIVAENLSKIYFLKNAKKTFTKQSRFKSWLNKFNLVSSYNNIFT